MQPAPQQFGKEAQQTIPKGDTPLASEKDKKIIQHVIGSFLYCRRTVDPLILHVLNTIALSQANPTENTVKIVHIFLNYMVTNTDAKFGTTYLI